MARELSRHTTSGLRSSWTQTKFLLMSMAHLTPWEEYLGEGKRGKVQTRSITTEIFGVRDTSNLGFGWTDAAHQALNLIQANPMIKVEISPAELPTVQNPTHRGQTKKNLSAKSFEKV